MENKDNNIYNRFKEAADKRENDSFPQIESIWSRIEEKLDDKKERRVIPWYKYAGVAAVLLLCLTVGTFIFKDNNTITTPAIPENNVTTIDYEKIKQAAESGQTDTLIKEEVVVNDSVRKFFTSGLKKNTAAKKPAVKNKKRNNLVSGKAHKRINQNNFIPFGKIKSSVITDSIIDSSVILNNEKNSLDIIQSLQGYVPGIKVEGLVPVYIQADSVVLKSVPGNLSAMNITSGDGPPGKTPNKAEPLPFRRIDKKVPADSSATPKQQFTADIKNNNLRLYVLGGIAAVITTKDREFAQQSGFIYHDFGCLAPPDISYYEKYNHLVLNHLKLNLKKGWQKEIAPNTIGFQSWEEKQIVKRH